MSSEFAIRVQGLGKAFPIYRKPHHRLLQMLSPGAGRHWHDEFHALKEINLEIGRGETVGIVGRNGSGKSTLLQLICGTLSPSEGTVEVNGRIAALLELGAGFNPEFTGRENVYLYGTVLGLTTAQIEQRFDAIAAFADIGRFLDQPVKTYSSGMFVRLAFAVAINVTPDILVVDEALSVGDEAFQRKCFARIEQIRQAGGTILFVSHSAGTVVDLCDHAYLLDGGTLLARGTPKRVISLYQKLLYAPSDRVDVIREDIRAGLESAADEMPVTDEADTSKSATETEPTLSAYFEEGLVPTSTLAYESRGASIEDPHLQTLDGRRVNVISPGESYRYSYRVSVAHRLARVRCGMMLRTVTGVEVAGTATASEGMGLEWVDAGTVMNVHFEFRAQLAPGTYFLNAGVLAVLEGGEQYVARLVDAAMFRVLPSPRILTALVDLDFESEAVVA